MGATAVQEANYRLPDGRRIRPLEGAYTQRMTFALRSSGLYAPETERIMLVEDHNQSYIAGVRESIKRSLPPDLSDTWMRTGEYAVYARGFFEKRDEPLGDRRVYVEHGIKNVLEIPDVGVSIARPGGASGRIGLRQAVGMAVIRLEKLRLKRVDDRHVISVTDGFTEADVRVLSRRDALILLDARSRLSGSERPVPSIKHAYVMAEDSLEGSTGYHGSLAYFVGNGVRVAANIPWACAFAVTVVERAAGGQ